MADLAAGTPLAPDHLFELGSIGKSFAALTVLRLVDEGRMDLGAPITEYLPWFEAGRAGSGPITIHHLLTHTAGLIGGSLGYPDPRAEVYALRRSSAVAPGLRYAYSNDGYQALGLAIARVTGRPYRDVVTDGILRPLGMDASTASIHAGIRDRLVTGHTPADDDRPWLAGNRLAPAGWVPTDFADGSICSTTADVAAYLRMLLRRGEGPSGRIVSAEGFERFMTPSAVRDPSVRRRVRRTASWSSGRGTVLSHSGGMVGHYANIVVDLASGIAVGAMVNGYGAPGLVSRHALALFNAAAAGVPLPDDPAIDDPHVIDDAATFAGRYGGDAGDLELIAGDRKLGAAGRWAGRSRWPGPRHRRSWSSTTRWASRSSSAGSRTAGWSRSTTASGATCPPTTGPRPNRRPPPRRRTSRSRACTGRRTRGCPCSASRGAGAASSSSTRRRAGASGSSPDGERAARRLPHAATTRRARSGSSSAIPSRAGRAASW